MKMMKKNNNNQKTNLNNNNGGVKSNGGWVAVPPELKPYSPEWFLSNYLEDWTDKDIEIAIRNDLRPDLSTYADTILDQTTDFFMNFLHTRRPDLTSVQTKEGKQWVRRLVKSATGFK